MTVDTIPTPALLLDKRAFYHNIRQMQNIARGGAALRPHYKSNKCPKIAKIQTEFGAKGITCAKLSEAEDAAAAGIGDILIANQIVQTEKLDALCKLALKCRLSVCVDNEENVLDIQAAAEKCGAIVYCLIEFETGMTRCGVGDFDSAASLAGLIMRQKNLRFEGIQAYAGHYSHETDNSARVSHVESLIKNIAAFRGYLVSIGIPVNQISGGSTGTSGIKAKSGVYTELQAGSYVFMDASYGHLNLPFQNSLFILSTVISVKPDYIVTDAGLKKCSVDQGPPVAAGLPSDSKITLSEEHSRIEIPGGHNFRIKDKLLLIPGHCCTTVNLFDKFYLTAGGEVEDIWEIVSRGKSE